MKLIPFFILVLLLGCAGSKTTPTPSKKLSVIDSIAAIENKPQDTVSTTPIKVIKITEELYVPPTNDTPEIIEQPLVNSKTPIQPFNHDTFNTLLKTHVSKDGNVNYNGLKQDWNTLRGYIAALGNNVPPERSPKNKTFAYWINAYNAMTLDLILRHYPIKSIKDIKNPWQQRYWKLEEKWYNLDDVEHKILRKMNEPRIHFAIVCASYSCPKLQNKAYTASNLETQLTTATKAFLNDKERNVISENDVWLSKIFQWFGKDFKKNGSLIDFINQYSSVEISNAAKIHFKDYDWSLNE